MGWGGVTRVWSQAGVLALLSVFCVTGVAAGRAFHRDYVGDREAAVESYVGALEQVAGVLSTVIDEQSAAEAAPRLRELARTMAVNKQSVDGVDATQRARLVLRYRDRAVAASERLRRQTRRIAARPAWVEEVREAIAAIPPLA